MLTFLEAVTPTPMTLQQVVEAVTSVISGVVSWMGSFLSAITATNGLLLISFVLSLSLFGIHIMKSLMGR